MANFYITLSQDAIAKQVATLLNLHNKLIRQHDLYSIKNSNLDYFVETVSSQVIGCVALVKPYNTLSLIKHLSVEPSFRQTGVAMRLIQTALSNCHTEYVHMTVREDNVPCLRLAYKIGFVFVNKVWSKDHYVVTLGRRTRNDNAGR